MSNAGFIYDDLIERLKRVDEDAALLYNDDRRFHMVIVGGGALILLETISRSTMDIDVLDASAEIRGLLEKYDINCNVQTYINNFPYNYEDRLVPLQIESQKIDFYCASLEDIVIAKLHSSRATDRQDILNPGVIKALDWELLDYLAHSENEAKASSLNDRVHQDFLVDYEEYIRRCRP